MRKKLIEVALPLEAINEASAREKSLRYGHPNTLHLWWARRPLATTRAVIFASLVDDPGHPAPNPEAIEAQRDALRRADAHLKGLTPEMPWGEFSPELNRLGFEVGWGDDAARVRETMQLLLDVLEAPSPTGLERFLTRESATYRPQMLRYRDALHAIAPSLLRVALYFTRIGHLHRLPVQDDSVDCVLLPHVLDYSDLPSALDALETICDASR